MPNPAASGTHVLTPASHVALLGFGAAAQHIAAALAPRGQALRAYDAALGDPASRDAWRNRVEAAGVDPADGLATALRGVRLVIVSDAGLLSQLPQHLQAGQFVLDLTAVPQAGTANAVMAAGAHHATGQYVSGDAMLHIAGPHAQVLAAALSALGLRSVANQDPPATTLVAANLPPLSGPVTVPRGELP